MGTGNTGTGCVGIQPPKALSCLENIANCQHDNNVKFAEQIQGMRSKLDSILGSEPQVSEKELQKPGVISIISVVNERLNDLENLISLFKHEVERLETL